MTAREYIEFGFMAIGFCVCAIFLAAISFFSMKYLFTLPARRRAVKKHSKYLSDIFVNVYGDMTGISTKNRNHRFKADVAL